MQKTKNLIEVYTNGGKGKKESRFLLYLYHKGSDFESVTPFRSQAEMLCLFLNGETDKLCGLDTEEGKQCLAWVNQYDRAGLLEAMELVKPRGVSSADLPITTSDIYRCFVVAMANGAHPKLGAYLETGWSSHSCTLSVHPLYFHPDLQAEYDEECDTFEKAVKFVSSHNIDDIVGNGKGFNSVDDFLSFVFFTGEGVIDYINRCSSCGRYFASKKKAIFCHSVCKQTCYIESRYGKDKELAGKFTSINAVFTRKGNSQFEYAYVSDKAQYSDDYDPTPLFSEAGIDVAKPLVAEDFKKLKQAFFAANEARRMDFLEAQEQHEQGLLTDGAFEQNRLEYLNWLTNVHSQVKSFSKAKSHF